MASNSAPPQPPKASVAPAGAVSKAAIYVLGLVGGLQMVDPSIANIVLVPVGKDLHFSGSQAALAASISTLALAATVLATGLMADRIGRRKLMIWAMFLAVIGDLMAAFTPVTAGYMAGRALAGIGVGAALAASFAYVRFVAPPEKVGAFLGLWSATMMVVMTIGTLIGGALATSSWRLAMLIVPVLALVLVPVVLRVLPPMPKVKTGSVDYLGLITIGVSTVLFLYGISQAAKSLTAPSFLIPTALGIAGFALFAFVEAKSKSPVFPIRLFLQGIFVAAVIAGIAWNLSQAVFQLASSNWWQYVPAVSTFEVSALQFPFLITVIVVSVVVGRILSARPGSLKTVLLVGYVIAVVGFLMTAVASVDGSAWWLVPGSIVIGLGIGMVQIPQSVMFVAAAPKAFFGAVTSFRTTVGQIGFAIGLAGSVVIVQAVTKTNFSTKLGEAGVEPSRYGEAIDKVQLFLGSGDEPSGKFAETAVEEAQRAYSHGFDILMVIMAGFLAVLGVLTWLALRRHERQTAEARSGAVAGDSSAPANADKSVADTEKEDAEATSDASDSSDQPRDQPGDSG
jgi:MFS family permease